MPCLRLVLITLARVCLDCGGTASPRAGPRLRVFQGARPADPHHQSRLYVSNEADTTLDVVDGRTLRVISKVPLTGHPNNIAASRDGARVYVAIRQAPGAVDVVDTASLQRVKSIPRIPTDRRGASSCSSPSSTALR